MTRNTRPYREVLLERLADAEVASHYLNEGLEESTSAFLKALFTVAQARQMSKVAKEAGVQRETLYRSLSEQGNPRLDTLLSILSAVEIGIKTFPKGKVNREASGSGGFSVEPLLSNYTASQVPVGTSRASAPWFHSGCTQFLVVDDLPYVAMNTAVPASPRLPRELGFLKPTPEPNIADVFSLDKAS